MLAAVMIAPAHAQTPSAAASGPVPLVTPVGPSGPAVNPADSSPGGARDGAPVASTSPVRSDADLPTTTLATHMALILPLRSPDFASAAEAVRNGVLAARDANVPQLQIVVYDTDDTAANVQEAYRKAADTQPAAIIGPLTRAAVQAVADTLDVLAPTVALNAIDVSVPSNMLMFALQIEAEARQVARYAAQDALAREPGRRPEAVVLLTDSPLQKRAVAAFAEAFGAAGGDIVQTLDATVDRGPALQKRVQALAPSLVFMAVDPALAGIVRQYLRDIPAYGTSQLNVRGDRARALDLEGVHFVDMPWLLQAEAPEVARYSRNDDPLRYSNDLERLYAMGIDALRIALDFSVHKPAIGFDGVTGALVLTGQRVERRGLPAVFRDGSAVTEGQ